MNLTLAPYPKAGLLCALALGISGLAQTSEAQYYGYNPGTLQKGFESADFFFNSTHLNPFGLDGFGPAAAGVIRHPLLDLQLSPSLLGRDSTRTTFGYIDFRSSKRQESPQDYIYPYFLEGDVRATSSETGLSGASYYNDRGYYQSSYRPAEPLLSAAVISKLAPVLLPRLTGGITYSLIADDQSYYDVPQNLYRNLDLANASAEADVPITDIYSGADQMHTIGHFPALFASYELSSRWRLGARVSFAVFDRDGEYGNTFDQSYFGQRDVSISSEFEERSQRYRHTDISIGIDGTLSPDVVIGGSLGRLSGTADQFAGGFSRYANQSGNVAGGGTEGYVFDSGAANQTDLSRTGTSTYLTAFVTRRLDEDRILNISYRGAWQAVDMEGQSSLADSSFSISQNGQTNYDYYNRYNAEFFDERTGSGKQDGTNHRISVGLDWRIVPKIRLVIGAVGNHTTQTTFTTESVVSSRLYDYEDRRQTPDDEQDEHYRESLSEVKNVEWSFSSRRSSVQIPVILRYEFNEHFEFTAGVTRRMEDRRVRDVTLALITLRTEEVNGVEAVRGNFGERFRQPTEFANEVSTSGILGLTARPSLRFDIQLLVSPKWSNRFDTRRTQWWLGFQFRP
ncbi:MAG: hypothetical protein ACI80V_003166 [Rhodothermales bacterium]|jgi:hypothetical protein